MDLSHFIEILQSFGVSVSASTFFQFMKNYLGTRTSEHVKEFETQLQSFLDINGANVRASTVINMFASRGLLQIQKSILYAPEKITIGAREKAQFIFGNDSTSSTDRTRIEAKGNAQIIGKNATIVQNPDGSISLLVGKKNDEQQKVYIEVNLRQQM